MNKIISNKKYFFKEFKKKPKDYELKNFYKNIFYSKKYKNYNDSSKENQRKEKFFYEIIFSRIINNIKRIHKNIKKKTFIDIGAGEGSFIKFLYNKKIFKQLYAAEYKNNFQKYIDKNKFFDLHDGLEAIIKKKIKFDYVSLIHVLEHVRDPISYIRNVKKILNKNGLLIIRVPNDFSRLQLALNSKKYWVNYPVHLNYFNFENFDYFLKKNGYLIKYKTADFPIEFFNLFGFNYVKNKKLGKKIHRYRVNFEKIIFKNDPDLLEKIYKGFADIGIGREMTYYVTKKK